MWGKSYTAGVGFSQGGFNNWSWAQFGKSVGIGAASGAVSFGIGSAASAISGVGGFAVQTAGHAAWGGINSMWSGGDFWSGALSGGIGNVTGSATAGMGAGIQVGVSALMGGISSDFAGESFWRGFAIGGTVAGANHLMHDPPGSFRKRMEAANKELLANAPKLEPITDALGIADYYLNGRSVGNIVYDLNGNPVKTDFSSYGSPDLIGGPLAKGDKAIKLGRILLNPKLWHNHKKAFLTMVGHKNFARAVGGNPDISFKGTKIILTGTGQGFKGKNYVTNYSIPDFVKWITR